MNPKYLKIALLLIFGSFLAVTVIFALVLFALKGTSCLPNLDAPVTSTCTREQACAMAMILIEKSPTFSYDGVRDSVQLVKAETPDNGQTWTIVYSYKTAHPGHGDRSHQQLAQVITAHTAEIIVTKCKITSAKCDKVFNLLTNSQP